MSNSKDKIDAGDLAECTACGTCCFSTAEDYLRVSGKDYERLGDDAERLTHFIENRAYMRLSEGHCAALVVDVPGRRFLCSVYEDRPDVCRWLQRGSSHCRAELHEKGQRPLIALRRGAARE
jgi:hypothetical protein